MFQLTSEEVESLRCQIGISNESRGGRRFRPYAFTEQGIAMLSGVLMSKRAVEANVAIMRWNGGSANKTGRSSMCSKPSKVLIGAQEPVSEPKRSIGFSTSQRL
jgi:hypothetical protein